jgi:hypothetical protein
MTQVPDPPRDLRALGLSTRAARTPPSRAWLTLSTPIVTSPQGGRDHDDVVKLPASALSSAQRRKAEEVARLALDAVELPTTARTVALVRGPIMDALQEWTEAVGGLPAARGDLVFNVCGSDPGVFTSWPRGSRSAFFSGGRCPLHQDYIPNGDEKCYTLYMLLQETAAADGATYVYPCSRHLVARAPSTTTTLGSLNPKALARDLERFCGPPIVLEGSRLDVFRHESAEWHGALPNAGSRPRSVLIWSYCSPPSHWPFQAHEVTESVRLG